MIEITSLELEGGIDLFLKVNDYYIIVDYANMVKDIDLSSLEITYKDFTKYIGGFYKTEVINYLKEDKLLFIKFKSLFVELGKFIKQIENYV